MNFVDINIIVEFNSLIIKMDLTGIEPVTSWVQILLQSNELYSVKLQLNLQKQINDLPLIYRPLSFLIKLTKILILL